jgi:hypothetical protein
MALLGLGAGVAARIWLARAFVGHAYSDNAIVGLEASHALHGRFYAFHWGQSYMGTLEALVIAPFFALFGVSEFVLSVGLIPWFLLFASALYTLTARCGGRSAASAVVWLAAVAPPLVLAYTVTPCGGYPETLVFGTVILSLTLRLVFEPASPRRTALTLAAIGGVAGLAFWSDWLVLPYFVVAGLYLVLGDPRLPLRPAAWVALAAFALGSAPLWVFNWHHHFATFAFVEGVKEATGRFESLRLALFDGLPQIVGVEPSGVGAVLAIAVLSILVFTLVDLRGSVRAIVAGRIRDSDPKLSLVLLVIASIAAYAVAIPSRVHQPRYLIPMASATMPLLAIGLVRLSRERRWLAAILPAVVCLYALQLFGFGQLLSAEPTRNGAGPVERLRDFLPKAGIRFAYADWGDAMITTFLTHERTIVTDYHERTYPLGEVDSREPAVILSNASGATAATTLQSLDASFSATQIPGYRVYWPIRYDGIPRRPLSRTGWTLTASVTPDDATLALDGDPDSAWSAPVAGSQPVLTLDLGRPQLVTGVFLSLGAWPRNAFHRLRIEGSVTGQDWERVKDARWDFPLSFRASGEISILPDDVQLVLFAPRTLRWIRMSLLERAYGHDWSVAELHVFGIGDRPGIAMPALADPGSLELVERRLRREFSLEPSTSWPLLELERLYAQTGERDRLAEVERLAAERFSPAVRVGWSFGGILRLLGYDARTIDDTELELTYYWQAQARMDRDYAVLLHVHGSAERFQGDYVLGAPGHPTHAWLPGEIVKQTERLVLPPGTSPGRYLAELGVWSPQERQRLRLGPWWHPARTGTLLWLEVTPQHVAVRAPT